MENNEIQKPKEKKTWLDRFISFKEWILGFGVIGLLIWWLIKILICIFAGICIL